MLKKDLKKKGKNWLADYAFALQNYVWDMQRTTFYEIPKEIINKLSTEAYQGKIDRADFWGALRYQIEFEKLAKELLNQVAGYERYKPLNLDDTFTGWGKHIRIRFDYPDEEENGI